jgi:hypothetical protein
MIVNVHDSAEGFWLPSIGSALMGYLCWSSLLM